MGSCEICPAAVIPSYSHSAALLPQQQRSHDDVICKHNNPLLRTHRHMHIICVCECVQCRTPPAGRVADVVVEPDVDAL